MRPEFLSALSDVFFLPSRPLSNVERGLSHTFHVRLFCYLFSSSRIQILFVVVKTTKFWNQTRWPHWLRTSATSTHTVYVFDPDASFCPWSPSHRRREEKRESIDGREGTSAFVAGRSATYGREKRREREREKRSKGERRERRAAVGLLQATSCSPAAATDTSS